MEEEHLHNIDTMMSRLKEAALMLRKSKCHCLLEKVEYLGHIISEKAYNHLMTKSEPSEMPLHLRM